MEMQLLRELNSEITLKGICEAQARASDVTAAEHVYELFGPYHDELQQQVTKNNYELGFQTWVEERVNGFIPSFKERTKNVIMVRFEWEPMERTLGYRPARFSRRQLAIVLHTLSVFSIDVGYPVELET